MQELMIENALLKVKILQYNREYLNKKGIKEPSTEEIIKMRKAVSFRLKREMIELSEKHKKITDKIYARSDAAVPLI